MASLSDRIKALLKLGRVSLAGSDEGRVPSQQVEYLGKVARAVPWYPFGFHAVADVDSLAVLVALQGLPEQRLAMPSSFPDRPTLVAGEVTVYHPASGSKIHFKSNGDVEVETATKVRVEAPESEFSGNVTVEGDLTIEGDVSAQGAGGVVIPAGPLTVTAGATALAATVTSNGVNISDTHVHSGVQSGASNTGPPT